VELNADAVPAELMHDATALRHGVLANFKTQAAQTLAWPDVGDANIHALLGHRHDLLGVLGYFPHGVHISRIAVVTTEDGGHVDVDNIAILEDALPRNAVANDLVHRDAGGLREAVVSFRCGDRPASADESFKPRVQVARACAGLDKGPDVLQTLPGQAAATLDGQDLFGGLNDNAHAGIIMH